MSLLPLHNRCNRGALYTGVSVLVALLLAGQATTAYFLYQQQGRLDKLTVTSQNLQLENLRMKLPKCACFSVPYLTDLISPFSPSPQPQDSDLNPWVPYSLGTGLMLSSLPHSCQTCEPDADGNSLDDASTAHG